MSIEEDHRGTRQVLLEDFVHNTLPVIKEMEAKVQAGQPLSEGDLQIMSEILAEGRDFGSTAEAFPDLKPMIAGAIELCEKITERALANEPGGA